ncbi:hypothetical protein [Niveibacterium terrae]|uniref:hypothetical protein n=1 Tax=Niveibacterium terrae TaxID=3373598 RepID=UPI003A8F1A02
MPQTLQALSVELRTIEFVERSRARGLTASIDLRSRGFRVAVDYEPELACGHLGTLKGVLSVAEVYVPPRYRRRGWLTHYLKMCELLAGDAWGFVREALVRRGFVSIEFAPEFLVMLKKTK